MLSRGQHAGGTLVVRGYRAAIDYRGRSTTSSRPASRPTTPAGGFRKRVDSNASETASVSDNGAEKPATTTSEKRTSAQTTASTASKLASLLRTPKKEVAPSDEGAEKGENLTADAMQAGRQEEAQKPAPELAECAFSGPPGSAS